MSEVMVYLYAPRKTFKGLRMRRERAVTIQRISPLPSSAAYTILDTLLETVVPVDDATPDVCYVIRGTIENEFPL